MKFPTDKEEDDEEDEVELDEATLEPEASIRVIQKSSLNSGNMERAKFIAYYFLGQYQILMEAANDLQIMLNNAEDGEVEDEEDDDEDEDDGDA